MALVPARPIAESEIESFIAFSIAIVACGVTVALWLRALAPLAGELGLS